MCREVPVAALNLGSSLAKNPAVRQQAELKNSPLLSLEPKSQRVRDLSRYP
jgi:hypothetical protein